MADTKDISIYTLETSASGWHNLTDEDGKEYSLPPDKWSDTVISAAKQAGVLKADVVQSKSGKWMCYPPNSGGGGKKFGGGGGGRAPVPEDQKFPAFAVSYAKDVVIAMIEKGLITDSADVSKTWGQMARGANMMMREFFEKKGSE